MTYIQLPSDDIRSVAFYLATEEYVARTKHVEEAFFTWQVKPSVIFGRNQVIEKEVNLPYCREHDISIFRRKSGGGCVYADLSNVMCAYITHDEDVRFTFNKYVGMVALMLCKMGVEATASGRNDILIDGKKVSGNAFYHIPGYSIVHGTMLFDTDMENMIRSITPSNDKLVSKGVESVRQHIALLKDYTNITTDEFRHTARQTLCRDTLLLDGEDVKNIEAMEQEYLSYGFLYGRNPQYQTVKTCRIDGVGEFEVRMDVRANRIRNLNIMGDFFLVGDIDNAIIKPLIGAELTASDIRSRLPQDLTGVVMNLKQSDFVDLLLQ